MHEIQTPPDSENTTVPARRKRLPNAALRSREHLTPSEVEKLIEAAKGNRWGLRDSTMILMLYRHALRAQELCDLEWSTIDWEKSEIHIRRVKCGRPSTHPIRGDELRILRKLEREKTGPFIFMSERGGPFTPGGSTA
jgi:integrase